MECKGIPISGTYTAPRTISFPHMGNYHAPIARLLRTVFPYDHVTPAPAMTLKTLELGSRHSPDYVCSPFKYNLGCYLQALERGADVLVQTGTGCRYAYFGALQEQILRDLGHRFTFLCFSRERAKPLAIYGALKANGSPLGPVRLLGAVLAALASIRLLDECEEVIRQNLPFERERGALDAIHTRLLAGMVGASALRAVWKLRRETRRALCAVPLTIPAKPLRVGVVGELYTVMDAFSNGDIERKLARRGISVSRPMSVSFLLLGKRDKRTLRKTGGYLRYPVGANGIDSVAWTRAFAAAGYDGVIHLKSFGCTPELNALPALRRLSADTGLPLLSLSYDTQTSETGLDTRLEAFCDMLEQRKRPDRTGA